MVSYAAGRCPILADADALLTAVLVLQRGLKA
jgi:hypothetical protein